METKTVLELNYYLKDKNLELKDTTKINLTDLGNSCYTLSNFSDYIQLHNSLKDWIEIHNVANSTMNSQNLYSEFIFFKKRQSEILGEGNTPLINLSENVNKSLFTKVADDYGNTYEGYLVDGKRQGFGCDTDTEGHQYIGEWNEDEREGKGYMQWQTGHKYLGGWASDLPEGEGQFTYEDGSLYIGQIEKGLKHGSGKIALVDGTIIEGIFHNDNYNDLQIDEEDLSIVYECNDLSEKTDPDRVITSNEETDPDRVISQDMRLEYLRAEVRKSKEIPEFKHKQINSNKEEIKKVVEDHNKETLKYQGELNISDSHVKVTKNQDTRHDLQHTGADACDHKEQYKEIAKKHCEIDKLKKDLDNHYQKQHWHKKSANVLYDQLDESKNQIKELEKNHTDGDSCGHKELLKEIPQKDCEMKDLKKNLDEQHQEHQWYQKSEDKLYAQLDEQKSKIQELEEKLAKVTSEKYAETSKLNIVATRYKNIAGEVDLQKSRITDLIKTNEELAKKLSKKESKVDTQQKKIKGLSVQNQDDTHQFDSQDDNAVQINIISPKNEVRLNRLDTVIKELTEGILQKNGRVNTEITIMKNLNTEQKSPTNIISNRIIQGDINGYFFEYDFHKREIKNKYGQLADGYIYSITATPDAKSLFISHYNGSFYQFDFETHKIINHFEVFRTISCCIVTYDNQYMITCRQYGGELQKWCIKTMEVLHTWNSNIEKNICSIACTHDSKYLLVGYASGFLSIFDLKNNIKLTTQKSLSDDIYSMVITKNNEFGYISDWTGNIRIFDFKTFKFLEKSKQIGMQNTKNICLVNNDEDLLVASDAIVKVYNTKSKKIVNTLKFSHTVMKISLINEDESFIIASKNGDLCVVDLKSLKIKHTYKDITKNYELTSIAVI